ncbi:MAG: hypothetical protein Q9181_001258 [Wetmoreana brouardii]
MTMIWQQFLTPAMLLIFRTVSALGIHNPVGLLQPVGDQTNSTASVKIQLLLWRKRRTANLEALIRCDKENSTLCDNSRKCYVPGTTTTLLLSETGNVIPAYDMQQVLDMAQQEIEQKLSMGNRRLLSTEIPWRHDGGDGQKIRIEARLNGWSWELLNNTIEGLRHCLFRQGIFEEVFVNGVVDPEALDSEGKRFLSLLRLRSNESNKPTIMDVVERCYDPETQTRLLYQLGDDIGAHNMQQTLDGAEQELTSKLASQGDRRVTIFPWVFRRDGLVITASFEGWSWQLLKNTVLALRLCLFRRGIFKEVNVLDTIGPVALSGQRYLTLGRETKAKGGSQF